VWLVGVQVVLHTNVSQMLPGDADANFRSFPNSVLFHLIRDPN